MTALPAEAAYRLWAGFYDGDPNPVLALEQRLLGERLALSPGLRALDLAAGTGRWLAHLLSNGCEAAGLDLSSDMLFQAARKPALNGRLVRGDLRALPFADDSADLAICSFALSYVPSPGDPLAEMARVSRRVLVSDLHPDAVRAGWVRGFRAGAGKHTLETFAHSNQAIDSSARAAGLCLLWRLSGSFGEPERHIFGRAGKSEAFEETRQIQAVQISCWERG